MPKQKNEHARTPVRRSIVLGHAGAIAPLLLAGCSGDVISLGERENAHAVPAYSRCQSSTTLEGAVRVESQEQLDALEGCEVIAGDLDIVAFLPTADLRPLHALTRVDGYVQVGGHLPVLSDDAAGSAPELVDAYFESIRDWLPSLAGLEQLESVDSLVISAPVSSLQPLSGLRHINNGNLQISSDVLQSLAGLEAIRGIDSLDVEGFELRDISAVRLPEEMTRLAIHAPITEWSASELKLAERVELVGTQLEDLDALEHLLEVHRLFYISDNPELRQMDGLDQLWTVGDLEVNGNRQLERMGDFASLILLDNLRVQNNDRLTELPSFPNYTRHDSEPLPVLQRGSVLPDVIEIRGNSKLRSLVMPPAWRAADVVMLDGTGLEAIDFGNMQSIGTLRVEANNALAEVNLGALSTAAYFALRNNPILSPTEFDGIRTLESHIDGNAPTP